MSFLSNHLEDDMLGDPNKLLKLTAIYRNPAMADTEAQARVFKLEATIVASYARDLGLITWPDYDEFVHKLSEAKITPRGQRHVIPTSDSLKEIEFVNPQRRDIAPDQARLFFLISCWTVLNEARWVFEPRSSDPNQLMKKHAFASRRDAFRSAITSMAIEQQQQQIVRLTQDRGVQYRIRTGLAPKLFRPEIHALIAQATFGRATLEHLAALLALLDDTTAAGKTPLPELKNEIERLVDELPEEMLLIAGARGVQKILARTRFDGSQDGVTAFAFGEALPQPQNTSQTPTARLVEIINKRRCLPKPIR